MRNALILATVAILAAGSVAVAVHRTPSLSGSANTPMPYLPEPPAGSPVPADPAGPADLIVQDGDLVEASGPVEGSRLCSPAPTPLAGDACPYGIAAPGAEPAGGVTIRARWHPDRLSDIEYLPYAPTTAGALGSGPDIPDTPPCPAPSGGWTANGNDLDDEPVRGYLRAHPDQFAEPFATHLGPARVLVVGVVGGDVDRARAALTAVHPGNLCVIAAPGEQSIAAGERLQATTGRALGELMDDQASGIYLTEPEDGRIRVNMIQLTRPLYDELSAIGFAHLIINPWIRPAV